MISSKTVTYKRKRNIPRFPTDKFPTVFENSIESNEHDSQQVDARDIPDGKRLCSTSIKQQNPEKSLKQQVLESSSIKEIKLLEESGLRPLKLSSVKVCRARRPGEATTEERNGSIHTDNSDAILVGLSSDVNSVPECKSPLTDESSILHSIKIETQEKPTTDCLETYKEGDGTFECTSASSMRTSHSANSDSHSKDNPCSSSSDDPQKNKFSNPVITFSRKNRKKENVSKIDEQNQLGKEKEHSLSGERQDKVKKDDTSSTTSEQNRKEDANSTYSEQNKKGDASSTSTMAGGVLETKMFMEQNQFTQESVLEEGLRNPATCLNSQPHLSSESPKFEPTVEVVPQKCIETPSTDLMGPKMMHEDIVYELPKVGDPIVEQSQILICDGVKEKRDGVSRYGSPVVHLDLSVVPEENIRKEEPSHQKHVIDTASETFHDSNHGASSSQRDKLGGSFGTPDLRHETSSPTEPMPRETCNSGENFTRLSMGISSEDPSKQSYIDESNQVSQLSQSGCRRKQCGNVPVDLSLDAHCLGLSLKSGPAIDFFKDSPSMPFSRQEPEMSLPYASDNSAYSHRHKQMLESIITRAGALKGNQGSSSSKSKEYTEVWSEEELDLLWVGVRRHGKGNWNAILNDPKFCFLRRGPADLAARWSLEQLRLKDTFAGRDCGKVGFRHSSYNTEGHLSSGSPMLIDDIQLSLGNTYARKDVVTPVRFSRPDAFTMVQQNLINNGSSDWVSSSYNELTHSVLRRIGSKQLHKPSGRQRNSSKSKPKLPRFEQKISLLRQVSEKPKAEFGLGGSFSNHEDNSPSRNDIPAGILLPKRNRPHWLRDLVQDLPFGQLELGILPNPVSAGAQTLNLLSQEYQRLVQQSSNRDSTVVQPTTHSTPNNYNHNPVSSLASLNCLNQEDERLSRLSSNNDSTVAPPSDRSTTENNVIVVDSDDASSEATISDKGD